MAANGQIATQYVDLEDKPTMNAVFKPNGFLLTIKGIVFSDGRAFGKKGHSERIGMYDIRMLESAVKYSK